MDQEILQQQNKYTEVPEHEDDKKCRVCDANACMYDKRHPENGSYCVIHFNSVILSKDPQAQATTIAPTELLQQLPAFEEQRRIAATDVVMRMFELNAAEKQASSASARSATGADVAEASGGGSASGSSSSRNVSKTGSINVKKRQNILSLAHVETLKNADSAAKKSRRALKILTNVASRGGRADEDDAIALGQSNSATRNESSNKVHTVDDTSSVSCSYCGSTNTIERTLETSDSRKAEVWGGGGSVRDTVVLAIKCIDCDMVTDTAELRAWG